MESFYIDNDESLTIRTRSPTVMTWWVPLRKRRFSRDRTYTQTGISASPFYLLKLYLKSRSQNEQHPEYWDMHISNSALVFFLRKFYIFLTKNEVGRTINNLE
jgi:hypothetical protein